jgi:hypothetical protein
MESEATDRIIEKLKSFYPVGSIQSCPSFIFEDSHRDTTGPNRPSKSKAVFKDVSLRIMKLEFEVEKVSPLKIACYLKYQLLSGKIRRKVSGKWDNYDSMGLSDYESDCALLVHMFGKMKYLGVQLIKFYQHETKDGILVGFGRMRRL